MQTYIVEPGDNIIGIANKLNVSVSDLVKENNLDNMYYLVPGLELVIPMVNGTNNNNYNNMNNSNNMNSDTNGNDYFEYYTVQKGDSLYQIGLKYNLTQQEIANLNGLELNEYIFPGQRLMLPRKGVKMYITKDGDTLSNIASSLGLTQEEIINTNRNIYLLPEQLIVYRG
ncbi:MAG: LysM peptidoglycan-binding domain-containing protein [Tenericutes bacterium]|nr:LysM peptidoglycan-binding domain-containing protein [Mycoplasmatota bacterium]